MLFICLYVLALFSKDDPTVLLARTSDAFFKPSASFEITGQVGNVCFLEGLVYFKRKWLLYYGTADSKIAVAEAIHYGYDSLPRKYKANPLEEDEEEEEEGNHSAALEALLAAKKLHSKLRYHESESTQTITEEEEEETTENRNKDGNSLIKNDEGSIGTPSSSSSTDKEVEEAAVIQKESPPSPLLEEEKETEKEIKDELKKASEMMALQQEF